MTLASGEALRTKKHFVFLHRSASNYFLLIAIDRELHLQSVVILLEKNWSLKVKH